MTRSRQSPAAPKAVPTVDQTPKRERDRPFEPWRRPASDNAKALVCEAIALFEAREAREFPRKRRRRDNDQQVMEETVAALVCDALHREFTDPGKRLMLSLSNQVLGTRSRYRAPVLSKALPRIVKVLEGEVLDVQKGKDGFFGLSRRTTIAIAESFWPTVGRFDVDLPDLRRVPGGEVVILKQSREDHWSEGTLLEYRNTSETRRFRKEVEQVNAHLATLDLGFDPHHAVAPQVDLGERALRRIFNNGRFDHGGRLFGGFWQGLKKRDRLEGLRIAGERIVELDFRQMAPRLLYARAGVVPPTDCYAVPGYERFREGWKKLFGALLFAGTGMRRLPKGVRRLLPGRMSFGEARRMLMDHNAPVVGLIAEDVGFSLMFEESETLIDILLTLGAQGVAVLPIHDAILVPASMRDQARGVMVEVFRSHTGQPGEVSVEE